MAHAAQQGPRVHAMKKYFGASKQSYEDWCKECESVVDRSPISSHVPQIPIACRNLWYHLCPVLKVVHLSLPIGDPFLASIFGIPC